MLDNFLLIVGLAGRICLGLVFAMAAIQKMLHWRVLEGVIGNYRLLPFSLIKPVTLLLPPVELILGVTLLAGLAIPVAAVTGIALLLAFALAMAVNIRRGRNHIDCGCHQSFLRQTLSPILVLRNLILAAVLAPATLLVVSPVPVILAVGIGAGVAFFLFYLMANTIMALPNLQQSALEHS